MRGAPFSARVLAVAGVAACVLALLSIADMYLPQPYDGVVLEADAPGQLIVAAVVEGSGAHEAGIRAGDRILGIGRDLLRTTAHAASLLGRYQVGESVPYLLETSTGRREAWVTLEPRRVGSVPYLVACALGFAFFLVGLFVFRKKPRDGSAQTFFLLSILFLLFLVCRLRPASYSGVDGFVLGMGTVALLLLPGTFLHFFAVFPRPLWDRKSSILHPLATDIVLRKGVLLALYLLPIAVYMITVSIQRAADRELFLISGAPRVNWWILGAYMVLGLSALTWNARRLPHANERRGAALIAFATLFGLIPFLVLTVAFPSFRHTERFLYAGVAPLLLVPLTFAYAIIRFQLLDIRVILRKSLFYTGATAAITAIYAAGIAAFNWAFQGSGFATQPYFPLVFALAVVLGLEPLRRRLQGPVDRFFLGDQARLQDTLIEMGEALRAEVDPAEPVRDLVNTLPKRLGLHFVALYRPQGGELVRAAGPEHLPVCLSPRLALHDLLATEGSVARVDELYPAEAELYELLRALEDRGVEVIGELASPRNRLGVLLLSGKTSQLAWDKKELELLRGVLAQAAIALETSRLLHERTRQAELERELEIAAEIQSSVLPDHVALAPGWQVAAVCRPARHVGGDFFSELPAGQNGSKALVYADVAGKSVPAALMMMAAQEVLHSIAMTHPEPERLLELANRRLYQLRRHSFVALGYLAATEWGRTLTYVLAGQPGLLRRRRDGRVEELPLDADRLPLGALLDAPHRPLMVDVDDGDVVLGYSDGVIEASSSTGEFFGTERLTAALGRGPGDPEGAVQAVLDAVAEFTGGGAPYDDLTLVAVSRQTERA